MTDIAAVTPPPPLALAPGTENPAPRSTPVTSASSEGENPVQPAVILSLSGNGAAPEAPKALGSLDPVKVDDALYGAAGANGFADIANHNDWAIDAAKFGKAIADRNAASVRGGAAETALDALSHASALGIPIQDSVSPYDVEGGAAPGTISIGAFSFTSGGSTYVVTPGANGTLVGTKDGQSWLTVQLTNPADQAPEETGAAAAPPVAQAPAQAPGNAQAQTASVNSAGAGGASANQPAAVVSLGSDAAPSQTSKAPVSLGQVKSDGTVSDDLATRKDWATALATLRAIVAPATIGIGAFSSAGGAVTLGKSGAPAGTKDDQVWGKWQPANPSNATTAAMQALMVLTAQSTMGRSLRSGLDVSI